MTSSEQIREQQRETWNKFSGGWKKHDDFVLEWLKPVGDKLIEDVDLKKGYVVLDAATGTGEPGISIARKVSGGKVIGTDVAKDMVTIAENKARNIGISNYEGRVCDESSMPFPDNYFDAVVCRFGVMYFPEPETAIRELVRVLKAGHKIALSAWAEPSKNPWATVASSIVNQALGIIPPAGNVPGIFRFSNPGALEAMFNQVGLRTVNQAEVKGELSFDSSEKYWEFIIDVIAPIATAIGKAPQNQQEEVKRAVMQSASKRSKDGKISFGWSAWVICGTK